jgi:serine/threonine-protein kinase
MIPESIGRYEVQCLLGEGAFGQVFAARDPVLGRGVAIKLLRSMYGKDPSFMARFRSEAASLASLAHPNITAIYDILEEEEQPGMVMELVHGHTLDHVLQQVRHLSLRECLAVTAQTAAGLGYIHRLGIVHRDIKPSNTMLTADGMLKIMDFGIARIQGTTRLTHDGSAVGTLAYAAPEQIKRDEGTPASDQYSLACMIYEMLSGSPPFDAATEFELMQAQISAMPEPVSTRVSGIPAEVDQALLRALSKPPGERFPSVEHLATALGANELQADATQILRDVTGRSGVLPPLPERRAGVAGRSSRPKSSKPGPVAAPGGLGANTPFLAMGAAVGIALAIGSFIILDQRAEPAATLQAADMKPNPQVASLPPVPVPLAPAPTVSPPPAPPAPPPVQQQEVETTRPAPPPSSLPVGPPPVAQQPPARSAPPREPPRSIRPDDEMTQKPTLDLAPNTGNEPTAEQLERYVGIPVDPAGPKEASKPAQRMPKGQPSYQGKVEDWIGGNLLFVQSPTGGVKKVDLSLFGIVGKKGSAREAAEIRTRLEAFAKGHVIKCWLRQEETQQRNVCFLDGADIALWALGQKLVEPSKNAPPEYLR